MTILTIEASIEVLVNGDPNIMRRVSVDVRDRGEFGIAANGGTDEQFDILDFAIICRKVAETKSTMSRIDYSFNGYSPITHWAANAVVAGADMYIGAYDHPRRGSLKYIDLALPSADGADINSFYIEIKPLRFLAFAEKLLTVGNTIRRNYERLLRRNV